MSSARLELIPSTQLDSSYRTRNTLKLGPIAVEQNEHEMKNTTNKHEHVNNKYVNNKHRFISEKIALQISSTFTEYNIVCV